jgi:type 1 glutamine amidotransferase
MSSTSLNRMHRILLLLLALGVAAFPQTRKRSQVESILGPATDTSAAFPRLNIVLVWGEKDHAAGQHEYGLFAQEWEPLLAKMKNVTVSRAYYWPSAAQWDSADLVVFHLRTHSCQGNTGIASSCVSKVPQTYMVGAPQFVQLDNFLTRGKGVVTVHPASYPHQAYEAAWGDRTGLYWKANATTFREGHLTLNFDKLSGHPLLAGLPGLPDTLQFEDEIYYPLFGHPDSVDVLASSRETFNAVTTAHPALWTYSPPGKTGRVYGFIMGHLHASFDDPVFRILLMRGMAWAGNDNFARYRRIVLDGADYVNDVVPVRPAPQTRKRGARPRLQGMFFEWNGDAWQGDGRKLLEAPRK